MAGSATLFFCPLNTLQSSRFENTPLLRTLAIAAFRAMLVRRPELVRVRLELARAFFLKEEDRLAERHFCTVTQPPATTSRR